MLGVGKDKSINVHTCRKFKCHHFFVKYARFKIKLFLVFNAYPAIYNMQLCHVMGERRVSELANFSFIENCFQIRRGGGGGAAPQSPANNTVSLATSLNFLKIHSLFFFKFQWGKKITFRKCVKMHSSLHFHYVIKLKSSNM